MAVTSDDVIWCYRNLLGREPESLPIAESHASTVTDFRALVLRFITSPEYVQKTNEHPAMASLDAPAMVPLDAPAMQIDLDATPAQMSLLRRGIREAWTHLGKTRPHHSVLSEQDFLPANVDQTIERFWARGATEVASLGAILKRHDFADLQAKTCVEYGSGLGRVTFALAGVFAKVHGYDISATHLEMATKRASELGTNNITFHLCSDDVVAEPLQECDFFYSRIVFQHNPPPLMRELILASLTSLREGGIGIFQVPTYGLGYKFSIEQYLADRHAMDMEMHCIPQHEVFLLAAMTGCEVLEVREDGSVGWAGRWISNTFVVRRPRSGGISKCPSGNFPSR